MFVDKEYILKSLKLYQTERAPKGWNDAMQRAIEVVEDAPTVDTGKVGRWEITNAYPHNVYCSECHIKFAQTGWAVWEDGSLPRNFCPHCGAKMKEDTDETD